jgi:hypothetical protein
MDHTRVSRLRGPLSLLSAAPSAAHPDCADIGSQSDGDALGQFLSPWTRMMHRDQRLCICPEVSRLGRGLAAAGVGLRASYVPSVDAAEALLGP